MNFFMSMIAVGLLFAGQAVAGEDPCEGEVGAGYGLCNAYCVAMNCNDPTAQEASDIACERVASNYYKITGLNINCSATQEDDCTVWTFDELEMVGTFGYEIVYEDLKQTDSLGNYWIIDSEQEPGGLSYATVNVRHWVDGSLSAHIGIQQDGVLLMNRVKYSLTQEEYDNCLVEIYAHKM